MNEIKKSFVVVEKKLASTSLSHLAIKALLCRKRKLKQNPHDSSRKLSTNRDVSYIHDNSLESKYLKTEENDSS